MREGIIVARAGNQLQNNVSVWGFYWDWNERGKHNGESRERSMRGKDSRSIDRLKYSQRWSGSPISYKKRGRYAVCVRLEWEREAQWREQGKIGERRRPNKAILERENKAMFSELRPHSKASLSGFCIACGWNTCFCRSQQLKCVVCS
jgi:hypothetical protein